MGHCGVKYSDPRRAGLANCDRNIVPDAPNRDPFVTEDVLGVSNCCANGVPTVATVERTAMEYATI